MTCLMEADLYCFEVVWRLLNTALSSSQFNSPLSSGLAALEAEDEVSRFAAAFRLSTV
jgi:hypothetical protein